MTIGDKLFGIETIYKGITMRSKLETKFAYFLDALGIEFLYEPRTFVLSKGITYIPDFYLVDLDVWVEVKGNIKEHNLEASRCFVKDNSTELLLISNEEAQWFSTKDFINGFNEDRNVFIGNCSRCNKYFFCGNLGDYRCRNCKFNNGDHDILWALQSQIFENSNINFYDSDSIKKGLINYGVRV